MSPKHGPKFKTGDRVLVNGGTVADIVHYDEEADRLVYKTSNGGGVNTAYGHISNTRLEPFPQAPGTGDEAHTGPVAVEDDEPEPAA